MNNKNSKTKKHLKLASVLSAITICSILGSSAQQAHANRFTDFFRGAINSLRSFFRLGGRSSTTTATGTSANVTLKRATKGTSAGSNDNMNNPNLQPVTTFDVDAVGESGGLGTPPRGKYIGYTKGENGRVQYKELDPSELKTPTYKSGTSKTQGTDGATGGSEKGKEPIYAKLDLKKLGGGSSGVRDNGNGTIYTKVKGSPGTDAPDLSRLNLKKGRSSSKESGKQSVFGLFQEGPMNSETPPPLPVKQNKYTTQSTGATGSSGSTGASGSSNLVNEPVKTPIKQPILSKLKKFFSTDKNNGSDSGTTKGATGPLKSSDVNLKDIESGKVTSFYNENSDDIISKPKTTTTTTKTTGTGTNPPKTPFEELKALFEGRSSRESDISYSSGLNQAISETPPPLPQRNESLASDSYTGPVGGNTGISPKAQKVLGFQDGYTGDFSSSGGPTGTRSKLLKKK